MPRNIPWTELAEVRPSTPNFRVLSMATTASSVILLPASNNFEETIEKVVPYGTLRRFIPSPIVEHLEVSCGGIGVSTWGLTPGKSGQHIQEWNDLKVGDVGVFTRHKEAFAAGYIVSTFHSAALSEHVWGRDADGQTWEYVFFLFPVQTLRPGIPYEILARALGYKPNWIVTRAQLIHPPASGALLDVLPIAVGAKREVVGLDKEGEQSLDELLELDSRREVQVRAEQSKIRKLLFGSAKTIHCALCGDEFPAELTIAAHVKRRTDCSDPEKRDFRNNVIPLCSFGCDELFERGFVVVLDNGKIAMNNNAEPVKVRQRLTFLNGRACPSFNESNSKYFRAHRARFKLSSPRTQ